MWITSDKTLVIWKIIEIMHLQLSNTVWHFCSSNGNFCKFIQQCSVAWIRVDMITVPSGDIDVSTSFSDVPNIDDERSLAKNKCGIHSESRRPLSPIIGSFRFGATSLKTKRGSTKRNCNKAWILNCCPQRSDKIQLMVENKMDDRNYGKLLATSFRTENKSVRLVDSE